MHALKKGGGGETEEEGVEEKENGKCVIKNKTFFSRF